MPVFERLKRNKNKRIVSLKEVRTMYDCIIIGAGISGCSLAFELSKYSGKVLWLEKNNDVADETTKANSAIIQTLKSIH